MSKGVALSVFASVLFGVLFFYVTLLDPLNGEEIFGWRMLLTAPCVTLFLLGSGEWRLAREVLGRVRRSPLLALGIVVSAALVGTQFWLFLWAPGNGRALETSLGYFLMPLGLVVIGRVLYRERLTRWQVAAALLAAVGVGNELLRVGKLSWVTLLVALGYPVYFVLRRQMRIDHIGGGWLEMHLMLPAAVWFVLTGPTPVTALPQHPSLFLLIPGLGLISAAALTSFLFASRVLKLGLFGLLSYLEPVLLVIVALLLGEGIAPGQWLTYVPIWGAVAVLFVEGMTRVLGQRSRSRGQARLQENPVTLSEREGSPGDAAARQGR